MVQEQQLKHKLVKDESDDSGISLHGLTDSDIVQKFTVQDDYIFQRFMIFSNGLIVCEEVSNGKRLFRFNKSFEELEGNKISFN